MKPPVVLLRKYQQPCWTEGVVYFVLKGKKEARKTSICWKNTMGYLDTELSFYFSTLIHSSFFSYFKSQKTTIPRLSCSLSWRGILPVGGIGRRLEDGWKGKSRTSYLFYLYFIWCIWVGLCLSCTFSRSFLYNLSFCHEDIPQLLFGLVTLGPGLW